MVRLLFTLLLLPTCSYAVMNPYLFGIAGSEGGDTTYYVGYPNTAGVPDDGSASWVGYGAASVDRVYALRWQATGGGTAIAIKLRTGGNTWNATGQWLCLYNGTDLIGQADVTYSFDQWLDYITLTEDSAGSLEFLENDILYIGFCYDNDVSGGALVYDENSNVFNTYYDNTNAISGNPNATATFAGPSGTAETLGLILKYTN